MVGHAWAQFTNGQVPEGRVLPAVDADSRESAGRGNEVETGGSVFTPPAASRRCDAIRDYSCVNFASGKSTTVLKIPSSNYGYFRDTQVPSQFTILLSKHKIRDTMNNTEGVYILNCHSLFIHIQNICRKKYEISKEV